jgi:hypothetical protein
MNVNFTEQELNEIKTYVKGLLRDENIPEVHVTFTKRDGTERILKCTLDESKIPEDKRPKEKTNSISSEEAIRVFDIEKQEWRSFRWDSVKSFGFTLS